ncbi:serine/threonine-protein phosphatase 1 regulatory subunit 10-like isoform X2 [Mytilus californianus]|uniref:serine/threonine-protein phosphatase 1 regulatory subunit 10-like isoform X2 n=1 Tax=Mytilus californianus TaxID=6549 RepID=UPI002246B768|nr:serine/threonine-protein phosphatase 1 regulatory subunit 10-like isoform X2 [Mytilus californianus]
MAEFKIAILSLVLLVIASVEANNRHKRQAWGGQQNPWMTGSGTGNSGLDLMNMMGGGMNNFGGGQNRGMGSGTGRGNIRSQNGWDHPPPPRHDQHPPPPQNHRNSQPPPPPPQQNWNHPPPPQNHWNHPPPPQNWHHPPPPLPVNPAPKKPAADVAGTLAALRRQLMMGIGVDTPDHKKNFNPAPVELLHYGCPHELPVQQCVVNPCPIRCKRFPMAKCYTNACGGCAPEWIQNGMKIIDCD